MQETPSALIARLRKEGVPERDIASTLGMPLQDMWAHIARWNGVRPAAKHIPQPIGTGGLPRYAQVARLHVEHRLLPREIAQIIGKSVSYTATYLSRARKEGLAPPAQTTRDRGGVDTWAYYAKKGATPPRGRISTLLDMFEPTEVERLIGMVGPGDATLAHTIARIVRERLDADTRTG